MAFWLQLAWCPWELNKADVLRRRRCLETGALALTRGGVWAATLVRALLAVEILKLPPVELHVQRSEAATAGTGVHGTDALWCEQVETEPAAFSAIDPIAVEARCAAEQDVPVPDVRPLKFSDCVCAHGVEAADVSWAEAVWHPPLRAPPPLRLGLRHVAPRGLGPIFAPTDAWDVRRAAAARRGTEGAAAPSLQYGWPLRQVVLLHLRKQGVWLHFPCDTLEDAGGLLRSSVGGGWHADSLAEILRTKQGARMDEDTHTHTHTHMQQLL